MMLRLELRYVWWVKILAEHDTQPTELSGGIMKCALGLWTLLPFDALNGSRALQDLRILPEWTWGVLMVGMGIHHLVALNDGHVFWRRWAAFAGSVFWLGVFVLFMHDAPTSFVSLVFLLSALWQCWCFVRLGLLPPDTPA